ncbi:MAG: Rieske 2Fe-2S domain-containing protein [Chloroflexota bacterium]
MSLPQRFRAQVDEFVDNYPGFKETSQDVARRIQDAIFAKGEQGRNVADVLHGKQIGHPLHPILTDITIGSWTLGAFFDLLAFLTRSPSSRKAADRLIALGTLSAIPTALAGITDFSGIKQDSAGHGAIHGIINSVALFFFWRSMRNRARNRHFSGFLYSTFGLGLMTLGAWLGGELVMSRRVGVSHIPEKQVADDWTPILPAADLKANKPQRIEIDGQPILLYKHAKHISAISAVCSHAGGPLEEGSIRDGCVQCPWHGSVFNLTDGHVVHGPATVEEPHYLTRVTDGQIELRRWRLGMDEYPIESSAVHSQNGQALKDQA